MKIVVQLLLLAGLALGAANSGAAPRAAEDPTAIVLSTTASAPRVKREAAHATPAAKKPNQAKHGSSKAKNKTGKKASKKTSKKTSKAHAK